VLENTFSMERVPARQRGSVASWRTFSFNVGWTLGSVVAGVVVSRFGFDSVFVASALLTVASAFTWHRRFGRRRLLTRFPLRPPGRRFDSSQ
jgi:predicted MFS family arabinose efflux permease